MTSKAAKLAERYNRETAQMERLQNRLDALRRQHTATYNAMSQALEPGERMSLGRDEPVEIVR